MLLGLFTRCLRSRASSLVVMCLNTPGKAPRSSAAISLNARALLSLAPALENAPSSRPQLSGSFVPSLGPGSLYEPLRTPASDWNCNESLPWPLDDQGGGAISSF